MKYTNTGRWGVLGSGGGRDLSRSSRSWSGGCKALTGGHPAPWRGTCRRIGSAALGPAAAVGRPGRGRSASASGDCHRISCRTRWPRTCAAAPDSPGPCTPGTGGAASGGGIRAPFAPRRAFASP